MPSTSTATATGSLGSAPSANRGRPTEGEFNPYYGKYIGLVPEGDILAVLRANGETLRAAIDAIPEARGSHAYAEGKWTVKTVLSHLCDAERIFSYRALRIGRGDATPLASFDENAYAATCNSDARTVAEVGAELRAVRAATVLLLESLPDDAWTRRGVASDSPVSVRALAYIIAGHTLHHLAILHERYGV